MHGIGDGLLTNGQAINDRIKELDFQDCKVRVTNVDSQASDDNIVIQVIGEISNKSAPHRKFTQTFVLAGQTNGYFVLNDIFRYIIEEQDEVVESEELPQDPSAALAPSGFQEPAPSVGETVPETLTSSTEPAAVEQSAAQVDKELEEKVLKEEPAAESAPAAAVNGVASDAEPEAKQSEEAAPPAAQETAAPEATEPEAAVPAETPKDPEPTPAVSPPKAAATPAAAPQKPAAPAVPAVPKSWASLAAAANRSAAPVATPQAAPAAAAPQPKAAAAPAPAPSQSPAPAAAGDPAREASPATTDEWTSVGDNKKQQNRGQAAAGAQEQPQNRAYIKNVHENVDAKDLRSTLEKFGKLTYFDISRQKVSSSVLGCIRIVTLMFCTELCFRRLRDCRWLPEGSCLQPTQDRWHRDRCRGAPPEARLLPIRPRRPWPWWFQGRFYSGPGPWQLSGPWWLRTRKRPWRCCFPRQRRCSSRINDLCRGHQPKSLCLRNPRSGTMLYCRPGFSHLH